MKLQRYTARLAAAAAIAALAIVTPASASSSAEESFTALRSIDAESLSSAQMHAITGQDGAAIAAALSAAAATAADPNTASLLTALSAAYSRITVPTARLIINRVLVKR
jgi:hypothetical protein